MKTKTKGFQRISDNFINKVILRFIPRSIKPNHVTIVRLLLVPIVYLFLVKNQLDLALLVFIIAASTDFVDGAMARTRNQITDLGKILDPIADKLLILIVLTYLESGYIIVRIFIFVIILELIAVLYGALFSFAIGKSIGANVFGKIKMVLQSCSVILFMLGLLIKSSLIIGISEYTLLIALAFAVLASIKNIQTKIPEIFRKK